LLAFLDFGYSDRSCTPAALFVPLSSLFVIRGCARTRAKGLAGAGSARA
jgi:hypothetical protein